MRVQQLARVSVVSLPLVAAGIAIASSGGAPASRTGAPAIATKSAEGTCVGCHNDYTLDSGASVQLVNAPNYYTAGTTYTFNVRVSSSQTSGSANREWAFELTCLNMADGNGAGTFADVAGQGTRIVSGTGQYSTRRYIESSTGDHAGASSPVTWQVQWTAPDPGVGSVGFFAAGLAANGNGSKSGDWVCTASSVIQDVTPVESATWGRVKALYH